MNATTTSDSDAGPTTPGLPGAASRAEDDPPREPKADGQRPVSVVESECGLSVLLDTDLAEPGLDGWLRSHLSRAVALIGQPVATLSVAVVDDPGMIELHQRYHQLDHTTDVLTFDLRDDPASPIEGDIVICYEEAARQAKARNHPVREELLLYAVHGLMHLLGEDDHEEEDYKRMHRREDDLLESLGFGRLFGGRGDAGDKPGAAREDQP